MKKTPLLLLLLPLLLIASAARAISPPEVLRAPVVVPAVMGFEAKVVDGRVIAKWKRYKRDDFYGYALLKSDKEDPAYVSKKALYETHDVGDLGYEDGRISAGTYYYRLVIITHFGDLWVSPVVVLHVAPGDLRRPPPTAADFE